MTVSEYICDFLVEKGVRCAFLVTGGQAMYLNDALGRRPEIRSICVHHEQAAGMSADAYGRIAGSPGVAMVTAGPGSINVVNGVVGGWTDSAPMIVISGQSAYSCVRYQEESGIRQFGIQGIYIRPFVEKAVKFFVTVDDPGRIRYYLEKAWHLATAGRPGPVWIDVPLDIQRMEVPTRLLDGYIPEEQAPARQFRQEQISRVLASLRDAHRPLLVAGQGVALAGARSEFLEAVRLLNIPVVTTRLGVDLLEYDHPLYVGHPGNYGDRAANFAVQNADLILAVGSRLATAAVGHNAAQFGRHAEKIVVDIDPKELEKPGIEFKLKIQADAKQFLGDLCRALAAEPMRVSDEWVRRCNGWKKRYPVVLPEYAEAVPLNSYYVIDRLSVLAAPGDTVLVDTGSCFHVACQAWKVKQGQRFLTTGGLSSMGYWCAGIGACAASGFRNTIVITGDGSLQMNLQEFATIRHNNLPVKVFILNNNGYLLIRQTQRNFMEGRLFGEGPESGVWCPDSMKIAEAYGIRGVRIASSDDLDERIREALAFDGPVICDVVVDPWQLLIPRVSSDKLPDGRLVSRRFEDMFPYLPEAELKANMIAELP
ncbi:thiamine pyrophosphate-binding protein [Victivallis vadensis]|uniref:Thiamine pyrophosphate-binding protein n=1 Tax=Victivallis vadensis TaxID=172901 RepID=A0A848APY6_9BACT|nr:thiamine pyrophosphate-binding protein [Victivallis vadensis]NMD85924.1 thiamine pyrophosphate-binding protein [Victivallis vadensis]